MPGPYELAAQTYRSLGWQGVLPVSGKDVNLPVGFTGRADRWPTDDEIAHWVEHRGADNVALRLPKDVLGIDIDAYDGRAGLQTIEHFESRYGELPVTWKSSSRTDGSGILLYRVPKGVTWVSDLGKDSDVQIIRWGHRYMVAWPSVHPWNHNQYRWWLPIGGGEATTPPRIEQLSELPMDWVRGLTKNRGGVAREMTNVPSDNDVDDMATEIERARRVDPTRVLAGLPPGEQDEGLYRYLCSLHSRNASREEMLALGMLAINGMQNSRPEDPWTPEHVVEKVNRILRDFRPGSSFQQDLSPRLLAWARGRQQPTNGITSLAPAPPAPTGPQVRSVAETSRAPETRTSDAPVPVASVASTVEATQGPDRMLDRAESVFEPLPNADDTDLGNTMRFVRLFKDQVRYNASTGNWYIWDGVKWQLDEVNCIMDLTKEVITDIRFQALATEGEEQTTLLRWAKNSESLRSRNAIVSGATSEPKLVVRAHDFDTNPHLLVVRNGTLDLETSTLRASRPEDLCSNQCTVDFDIMAECPKWLGHIEFITQGDKELARYMQIAMGYSLTGYGSSHERAFFFLEGDGANGKNVFIEPIMEILGSYAMVSDGSLLTGDEKSHPAIFADLYGKRFVFVDETRAGRRLNAERVKALVGSKRIKGRYMHKDWFEFEGRFKLWIAGNGRPTMQDTSDGIWTRLHEVPMLGKVGRDVAPVKDYGSVLYREEASGILNWMLEGFRMWTEFGLVKPAIVQRTTDEHRDDEDLEGQFIDECLEVTGSLDDRLMSDAIFNAWFVWAIQSGVSKYQIGTKADFIRRIRGRITKLTGIEQNSKNAVMRDPVTKKPGRGLIGVRFSPYVTFQQ